MRRNRRVSRIPSSQQQDANSCQEEQKKHTHIHHINNKNNTHYVDKHASHGGPPNDLRIRRAIRPRPARPNISKNIQSILGPPHALPYLRLAQFLCSITLPPQARPWQRADPKPETHWHRNPYQHDPYAHLRCHRRA